MTALYLFLAYCVLCWTWAAFDKAEPSCGRWGRLLW